MSTKGRGVQYQREHISPIVPQKAHCHFALTLDGEFSLSILRHSFAAIRFHFLGIPTQTKTHTLSKDFSRVPAPD